MYPAILTTHVRLPEQCSETVTYVERSLSVYISDVRLNAVALAESTTSCPGLELANTLFMKPSLEAIMRGDYGVLLEEDIYDHSDASGEGVDFDPFSAGEEDDGVCFVLPPNILLTMVYNRNHNSKFPGRHQHK